MKFFILEVSLSLMKCWRNALNDEKNEGYLKKIFRVSAILKVCTWRFLSFFGTAYETQIL